MKGDNIMRPNTGVLLEGLNDAFNREIITAIRYMLQGSTIQGLENEPLRQMYRSELADELRHAQYLADKIVMMGSVPQLLAQVSLPLTDPEEMMDRDLVEEESDIEHYRTLAKLAEDAGDTELKLKMEEQAADETRHAERLRRLRGTVATGARDSVSRDSVSDQELRGTFS
jgi:bacterioferritin